MGVTIDVQIGALSLLVFSHVRVGLATKIAVLSLLLDICQHIWEDSNAGFVRSVTSLLLNAWFFCLACLRCETCFPNVLCDKEKKSMCMQNGVWPESHFLCLD